MNMWLYSTPNDQFGVKPYSRPTPTAPPQRDSSIGAVRRYQAGNGREAGVIVAGHGRAALDVEQRVVPGVADLAGEQAESIDAGVIGEARERAGCSGSTVEVGPVALRFEAEHPGSRLPAIADLATGRAAALHHGSLRQGPVQHEAPEMFKSQHLRLVPQPPLAPM